MNRMNYITKQDFIANNTSLRGTIALVILKSKWSKAEIGKEQDKTR
jgi:hypothetical protein